MGVKSRIYMDEQVDNKDRRFGSETTYYPVYVTRADGEEVEALFTINQIESAILRGKKNPEDMPEMAGWLERVFTTDIE